MLDNITKQLRLIQKAFLIAFFPISLVVILSLHNYYTSPRYELPDDKFFTAFEHIKTDQFIWTLDLGNGGIYWVGDNEVVLDALINNERGIYQVNVLTGDHIKLVDYPEKPFRYCFAQDERLLYVSVDMLGQQLSILHQPKNYRITSQVWARKESGLEVSGIRCGFFKLPSGPFRRGASFALHKDDGLLRHVGSDDGRAMGAYIANNLGEKILVLTDDAEIAQRITGWHFYVPHLDAYFGYSLGSSCSGVWWLFKQNWELATDVLCFGDWAQLGSRVIRPTKAGFHVELHNNSTPNIPKVYLVTSSQEFPIQLSSARGSSTSPDGCRVAYGSGDYRTRRGDNDLRQHLTIFNACEFIRSK